MKPAQPTASTLEVFELSRAMRHYLNRRARAQGHTHEQWRVLWHLSRNQGLSQASLAAILEVQPISLTRTLDRLAEAGLIERRPSPTDRRAMQLFLTPEAAPTITAMNAAIEEFRLLGVAGMSADEQAQLSALLQRMRANFDKQNAADAATRVA